MTDLRLIDYLDHMQTAAADACRFLEDLDQADFSADKRTQQAVTMSLIIIGEAATRVMDRHAEFTAQHPEIPWRSMRGMRNRIAHGYFGIDLDVVWSTVRTALPDLITKLAQVRSSVATGGTGPQDNE